MTKDELIVKQLLEIENLKELLEDKRQRLEIIGNICRAEDGPLRGNIKKYTPDQKQDFLRLIR